MKSTIACGAGRLHGGFRRRRARAGCRYSHDRQARRTHVGHSRDQGRQGRHLRARTRRGRSSGTGRRRVVRAPRSSSWCTAAFLPRPWRSTWPIAIIRGWSTLTPWGFLLCRGHDRLWPLTQPPLDGRPPQCSSAQQKTSTTRNAAEAWPSIMFSSAATAKPDIECRSKSISSAGAQRQARARYQLRRAGRGAASAPARSSGGIRKRSTAM